jgi:hypothetical protein
MGFLSLCELKEPNDLVQFILVDEVFLNDSSGFLVGLGEDNVVVVGFDGDLVAHVLPPET